MKNSNRFTTRKLVYRNTKLLLVVLIFLTIQCVGLAQNTFNLSGRVTDENNQALTGANVVLKDSGKGVVTNSNGEFSISNIKESQINITISFLGYESVEIDHNFVKSDNNNLSIKLKPSSKNIKQVTISGETTGQTKAMIDQQRAENIKNIVSAEQIEQFPDMNAAEAMQRITGITLQRDQGEGKYVQLRGTPPELTSFNINGEQIPSPEGDVRYVGMDIISADQIESIEVTKVLTPDMDADGIAGSVNIVTKKARSETPEFKVSTAVGYNQLRETNNYNLQFSYGARKNNFGFQLDGNYYQNAQGSDNMESKYAKMPFWADTTSGQGNYHIGYKELQLRYYETTRKRTGLSATFDYEFSPKHNIYVRGMINQFEDDEVRFRKIYDLEDAANINTYLYGSVVHDVKYRTKNQSVNTLNMGANHDLKLVILDYELAYSVALEDVPNRINSEFENPGQALETTLDYDRTTFPKPIFKNPVHDSIANDYANYEFKKLELRKEKVDDNNLTAKINVKIPLNTFSSYRGYIKFGGKVRQKHKERDVNAKIFDDYRHDWRMYPSTRPYDELTLPSVSREFLTDDLLGQGYLIDNMPDPNKMREFYDFNAFHFKYGDNADTETRVESTTLDYKADELIKALYGMVRLDINNVMILGGVRYEYTKINYAGQRVILNERGYYDTIIDNSDSREHSFLLPQFQLKYSFTDRLNIRGAMTYSFARPNFEDVIPNREVDGDEIKYGNPDLKYPLSMNVDFMVEQYLNHDGILSGGIYYKNIQDFISRYTVIATEGNVGTGTSTSEITMAVNGIEAFVYGAEFQCQFKFSFLPGFLSNFGVYSNYAFTHSDAIINERIPANYSDLEVNVYEDGVEILSDSSRLEHISLPGQAMHSANVAFFYESKKIYTKLSANYHDSFLLELGADADLDEYIDAAWHIDFTASYKILDNLKCFVDIINITDTPTTSYLGNTNYLKKQEYTSWWGRMGIKLNF
jgi:TonB-dependent receptor